LLQRYVDRPQRQREHAVVQLVSFNGSEFDLSDVGRRAVEILARWRGVEVVLAPGEAMGREEAARLGDAIEMGMQQLRRGEMTGLEQAERALLTTVFGQRTEAHWRNFPTFCRRGGFRVQAVN